jgi:hypothetical protein
MVTLWFGISKEMMWLQKFAKNFWNSKNMVIPWVDQGQRIIMDQLGHWGL